MKTIVVGCDHAGFELKQTLKKMLSKDYRIIDVGAHREVPDDDYPDYAEKLGHTVLEEKGRRGILICGSGVGASVAVNKIKDIRAAVCHDVYSAHQGVEHDDMNVLVLGSRIIGEALAKDLVIAFLGAKFSGEKRHVRRLAKVAALEKNFQQPGEH